MGIAERREREKEALRTLILEAARDILSEEGLEALSMRAIAERIEYSPATIYLYFRDKDELIREVVAAGFGRLNEYMREELAAVVEAGNALDEFAGLGRAYARFALENTAYFRVMFELPKVAAQVDCPGPTLEPCAELIDEKPFDFVVNTVREAAETGIVSMPDPLQGALIGWGVVHGLTSLYLSGHLRDAIESHEQFMELITAAQLTLYQGWQPRTAAQAEVLETETQAVP